MKEKWDFVSEPNKCEGRSPGSNVVQDCPIAKISPPGAKIGNICHKLSAHAPRGVHGSPEPDVVQDVGFDVEYALNDYGQQICRVKRRIAHSVKMTKEQQDFVTWYRRFFSGDRDLPCLQCSDSRIMACSKIEIERTYNVGCIGFKIYATGRTD